MPRKFFEGHVKPNYNDWLAAPLDERLAKNAVADVNNMAARVFDHWRSQGAAQVFGVKNEGEYRNALAAKECGDFGLVRDVAEAHKHVILDRKSRRLTRSDQTGVAQMGYGEGGYGEGAYGCGDQLVVELDDGTKRALTAIMGNAMDMWERLLNSWGM